MLASLLELYPKQSHYEIGDGFLSVPDKHVFSTILDVRLLGVKSGLIQRDQLEQLVRAEDFGHDEGGLWCESEGERSYIAIRSGVDHTLRLANAFLDKDVLDSPSLCKSLRKASTRKYRFVSFEDNKVYFLNEEFKHLETLQVDFDFGSPTNYDLKLIKKALKLKDDPAKISIGQLNNSLFPMRFDWVDSFAYVANYVPIES